MPKTPSKRAWTTGRLLGGGVTLAECHAASAMWPHRKAWNTDSWISEFYEIAKKQGLKLQTPMGGDDVYRLVPEEAWVPATPPPRFDAAKLIPLIEEQYRDNGFAFGARGWGYIMEGLGIIDKGDFDAFGTWLARMRMNGSLDPDVVSPDKTRETLSFLSGRFTGLDTEDIDKFAGGHVLAAREQMRDAVPKAYSDIVNAPFRAASTIEDAIRSARSAVSRYRPFDEFQATDYYLEILVEKVDLYVIFAALCSNYPIRMTNAKGNFDVNVRRSMLKRFKEAHGRGQKCILLYFGDHDPVGINIAKFLRRNLRKCARIQDVRWDPFPGDGGILIDDSDDDSEGIDIDIDIDGSDDTANAIIEIIYVGLTATQIGKLEKIEWIEGLTTSSGQDLGWEGDDTLPEKNPKRKPHKLRYAPFVVDYIARYGKRKVEANALALYPREGQAIMEDAINQFIPKDWKTLYEQKLQPFRDEAVEAFDEQLAEPVDYSATSDDPRHWGETASDREWKDKLLDAFRARQGDIDRDWDDDPSIATEFLEWYAEWVEENPEP